MMISDVSCYVEEVRQVSSSRLGVIEIDGISYSYPFGMDDIIVDVKKIIRLWCQSILLKMS